MNPRLFGALLAATTALAASGAARSSPEDDRQAVAALDVKYQEAVKGNDADTMARILDDNFVLVLGNGTVYTREDLLDSARKRRRRLRETGRGSGHANGARMGRHGGRDRETLAQGDERR